MRGHHSLGGIRGCQPTNLIVAVYGEGVVVVGLVFEFGIIGAKAEGVGVMRRRRRVVVFLHTSKAVSSQTPSQTSLGIGFVWLRFENPKTV